MSLGSIMYTYTSLYVVVDVGDVIVMLIGRCGEVVLRLGVQWVPLQGKLSEK